MSIVAKRLYGSCTWYRGIGLGPDHIVLDVDPAPPPDLKRVTSPTFRRMFIDTDTDTDTASPNLSGRRLDV